MNRPAAVFAALAAGLAVLAVGGRLLLADGLRQPALPSPAVYARSAPVRSADVSAGQWTAEQFSGLAAGASWLAPVGRSVLDYCSVQSGSAGLLGGGSGHSFSCSRTEARYYAYRGAGHDRRAQLQRALQRQGWGQFLPLGPSPRPVTDAHWISAGDQPPAPDPDLRFSWVSPGRLDVVHDLGGIGALAAPDRATYLQTVRASRSAILSQLDPGEQVLIVAVSLRYAYQPDRK